MLLRVDCGYCNRGCGILAKRFQDDGRVFNSYLSYLLGHEKPMFLVAHDHRALTL